MKHFFVSLLFFFGAAFAFIPADTQAAGLVPCGRSDGNASEKAPCTICHVVVGGNAIIEWGRNIMTVIAITVIFAMAVLYVISAGNQGMMETAKSGIKAALIGFAVMLSAWLLVNVILTVLVDTTAGKPFNGLVKNGAFEFKCDTTSNVHTLP